jgi:IclR family transcriptional regulator, KDG regulon repressor
MGKRQSDYYVESIKKAIQIINSFTINEKELGVTELSRKLTLHKSTIHRIMVTLASEGIVIKNQENQKYRLGIAFFKWGCIVQHQIEIIKYAFPIMEELAKKTEESIYLNVVIGRKRMSIEKVESVRDIRRVIKLGETLPLYTGGSGKALLAYLPEEEINKFIKEEELISFTPNTIVDKKKLLKNLKEIRERGYAIAIGERVLGATTIGSPVFDYTGKVCASISVSGPTERITQQKIDLFASLVKESAMKISILLGYQLSTKNQRFY